MTEKSKKITETPKQISVLRRALPQVLAVSVKNVLLLGFGMTLGFPTILIPSLSGGHPEENIVLGQEEISWIGSVNYLCVPLGCLLSGVLTQPLGRRRAMQMVNLPLLAAWLLFHFATESWHVFLALCMTGFSGGLMEAPTITYLSEVTTPNLRGALASTSTVAVISGVLIQFLLGTLLHWRTVALVSCVLPVLSCVLLFFVPESPYWLVSKNRVEDAQRSIAWLRGWLEMEDVEKEFKEFYEQLKQSSVANGNATSSSTNKNSVWTTKVNDIKKNMKLYGKKNFLWPFALVSFTFGLGHFSGMTTLQTYAVSIFATLRAPINKLYATVILGIAEVCGCILSSILVHFVGKRKMNFFSLFGTGFCFLVVATYAHFIDVKYLQTTAIQVTEEVRLQGETWLPLTFLIGAAFFSHAGIRILPWMLIGEVYYSDIRATASGFSGAVSYICGFVSNKIFFSMVASLTLPGTYWFYSAMCLLGLILLYFWLPETEGKTLFQITQHFAGGVPLDNKVDNFIKMRKIRQKEEEITLEKEKNDFETKLAGVINKGFDEKNEFKNNGSINVRL